LLQCYEDCVYDAVRPAQDITVPEPQNPVPLLPQERISMQIFRSPVEVLATIKLNDDCGFKANEITNVDANRMLPSELEALQLAAT
jgi:hypothetical protein